MTNTSPEASATEINGWTPGDGWDRGSSSSPVNNGTFSGQLRILTEEANRHPLYAFVDEGGFLEARFNFYARTQVQAQGIGVVRVTSPEGVEREFTVDFGGQQGDHVVTIQGATLHSPNAGVWIIDAFFRGTEGQTGSTTRFDVVPRDADGTVHQGRVWAYNFVRTMDGIYRNPDLENIRRPNPVPISFGRLDTQYVWDQSTWIWSETGLLVRVDDMGYNGIHSNISATSHGLVDENCQPLRHSTLNVSLTYIFQRNVECGLPFYRVFFEHPDLTMPDFARYPDGSTRRINFPLEELSVDSITYQQTGTGDVFAGQIAIALSGHPTTVRVDIDTDGDGNFNGPADRVLFESWTLQPGTTLLPWNGLDGNGVPVPLDREIGIQVTMVGSYETHIVAVDVEVRAGGIRLTALNGPNAASPATRYLVNWDDRNPAFFDPATGAPLCSGNNLQSTLCPDGHLMPSPIHGVNVNSVNGVHRWNVPPGASGIQEQSWGDARSIVTWQVADLSDMDSITVRIEATGVDITIGDDLIIGDNEQFFCPVLEGGLLPVVVTNHGPNAATGVRVSLPAGVTLAPGQSVTYTAGHSHPVLIGNLAVGQSATFYVHTTLTDCGWNVPVQVIIDQTNILPEERQNDVSVGQVPPPPAIPEVDLEIEIDLPVGGDGQPVVPMCPPATDVQLLVTVTNHGPQHGTDVTVTLPAGTTVAPNQNHVSVSGNLVGIGDMLVGAEVNFYVLAPLSDECSWNVTVTVEGAEYDPYLPNNQDTSTGVADTPETDLEIEIEVPVDEDGEPVVPVCPPAGDIELLVTVSNHGPQDATGVTVTLPAGTVLAPNQTHVSVSGNLVTIGNLAVGGQVTFYVISPLSQDCEWNVTVTVEGNEYDPNEDNNDDTSTGTAPEPEVDLEIIIDLPVDDVTGEPVMPICPPAGDVQLLVTVTNHGPQDGNDVTVTLPAGTVLVPGQNGVTASGSSVVIGELAVGETVTFYVLSDLSDECSWDVTVTVTGREYDPNLTNNTDNSTGLADGPPADLEIDIDVPVDEDGEPVLPLCPPAGEIPLLVTVTNHGPYIGTDVTVTLPAGTVVAPDQDHVSVLAGGLVFLGDLEVGEQVVFYVISPLSEDCEWDVTVSVEGRGDDPDLTNNEDDTTGTAPHPEVDLEIEIDVPVDDETGEPILPICPPAGEIELLVTVTNHGPHDGHDITVTLPEGTVVAPEQDHVAVNGNLVTVGDLAVGDYVTFYVISPLSEDCAWDVTVTVEGREYDPNLDNNEDTTTGVAPGPEADLEIEIEVPVDEDGEPVLPICPPAGEIELLVTVTNHGPYLGTDVTVTLPEGTVVVEGQDHISVTEEGLVFLGDMEVDEYVTFYVISPLSEECAWDVTVTVEGRGYDPNLDNNEDTTTGVAPGPEADLEIEIDVPVDEDGEPILPTCPPAGDIELLVTVTNHGPYLGTDVTVTLPAGTVLADGQDHVTVNEGGYLVFLGDIEVGDVVTFYVISPLSEECAWDVTVSVEGRGYDPNLENNEDDTTGVVPGPPADLEVGIELPVDPDTGLPVLPVCPPAGEIPLVVTVSNHGPYIGTDVTVTLPEGTVLAPGQGHVGVNEGGYLVLVGDLEVGDQVVFYVISPLSQDCEWDVTVSVEGRGYDPNLDNNEDNHAGSPDIFPGLGGGQELPGGGIDGGDGPGAGIDGPDGPYGPGGPGAGGAGGPGGPGVGTGVRAPGRLPLTGASGIWIAGAGLAVVGGLLLALNNRKTKAAADK